ncbi:MAG: hypothetical protein LCI03_04195 [Actinobacteria bacterium]|nr:hypothetical protein [Actinomycetota bacterium]
MRKALAVVAGLVAAVVVGWFGYQVYVHLTDAHQADQRLTEVAQAWEDDPAALAAASAGEPDVVPASLAQSPFLTMGARSIDWYAVDGTTMTVGYWGGVCLEPPMTGDVRAGAETVVVLVHPRTSWLPDLDGLRTQGCTDQAVALTATVELPDTVGERVVVDAVSGASAHEGRRALIP